MASYTGYLFVYILQEREKLGEQIYFALSRDGLHWMDLNEGSRSWFRISERRA